MIGVTASDRGHCLRITRYTARRPRRGGQQEVLHSIKVIGIRPLAPVQNSVSLELIQRKTLNFVTALPDVENITK